MPMKTIQAKFGNMRKEAEFVVYPMHTSKDHILLQSDHRFVVINRVPIHRTWHRKRVRTLITFL